MVNVSFIPRLVPSVSLVLRGGGRLGVVVDVLLRFLWGPEVSPLALFVSGFYRR